LRVFSTLLLIAISFASPSFLLGDPPTIVSAIKFPIVARPLVSHRMLEQTKPGERPALELVVDKWELQLLEKLQDLKADPNFRSDPLHAERIATVERCLTRRRSSNPTGIDERVVVER